MPQKHCLNARNFYDLLPSFDDRLLDLSIQIIEHSQENPPTPLVGAGRAMELSKLCCYANSFAKGGKNGKTGIVGQFLFSVAL